MAISGQDSLGVRGQLDVGGTSYDYFSLEAAAKQLGDVSRLPYSLKVLLENLLRYEDGRSVKGENIEAAVAWLKNRRSDQELSLIHI